MSESDKIIPDGYHPINPYLVVRNGAKAIEFYKKALGA
jgi:PhnB protein